MNKIVCKIELFDINQKIFLNDGESMNLIAESHLSDLPKTLATLSYSKSAPRVIVWGNAFYAEEVATKTREYAKTNYSNYNIKVEVL